MAQVLVSGSHSQILVTERLRNSVDIGTAHSHPTCRSMAQIVEPKICYPDIGTGLPEGLRHIISVYSLKN